MSRKVALLTLISLSFLFTHPASSGTSHLVLDINQVGLPKSSHPNTVGVLGNSALFRVTLETAGALQGGLVKSDGTPAGTTMLKTFAGSGPENRAVTIGTRAFFDAAEDASGHQLWVTDGTSSGTRQVTSLPVISYESLQLIGTFGTDVLFARRTGVAKYQLYRSDGTASGTTLIAPITGYGNDYKSFELVVVGTRLYFIATADDTQQTELWVSDGTAAGTHKIPAVNTLASQVSIHGLQALNGNVVFVSDTNTFASELTLVTPSEVVALIELAPGAASGALGAPTVMNGYAYFTGSTDGVDYELWRSDGTPGGTTMVKDINPTASSMVHGADVLRIGDRVVFAADDGSGTKLWSSDGTASGTVPLTPAVSFPADALRAPLATDSVKYRYIAAVLGSAATTIITDGTPAGTGIVPATVGNDRMLLLRAAGDATTEYVDLSMVNQATGDSKHALYKFTPPSLYTPVYSSTYNIGMGALVVVNGKLLFDGNDGTAGSELWVSDDSGARLLVDFQPLVPTFNSSPAWFTDWNGKAVFVADDGVHGKELWISDGTSGGTRLLADAYPGAPGWDPRPLAVWNGAFYFFASDGTSYHVMRMTSPDATPEVLATAGPPPRFGDGGAPEPYRCAIPNAVPLGNKLVFSARTFQAGTELWATDGTAAGTAMVLDINTNPYSNLAPMGSQPCGLQVFQNRVYFTADASAIQADSALWSTDGTAAGTTRFSNLTAAGSPLVYRNELYFRAGKVGDTLGSQTWKTDGTEAGTRTVVPATSLSDKLDAYPLGISNGKLILYGVNIATPQPLTYTLWASDGTSSAPVKFATNIPLTNILTAANRVYFSNTEGGDEEPWVSDGTLAGTHRLADLDSAGSSHPYAYMDFRGVAVILTNDSTGPHAWRSDGTEGGTVQIGKIPRRPSLLTFGVAGQNLFFNAVDPLLGDELFAVSNDAPVAVADSASAANGAAVTINVLSNDADADGSLDASSVRVAQAPAHGTTSVGANGAITYTPAAGYSGTDTFTYTIADNQGYASNPATVTLTVTAASSSNGGGGNNGGGGGGGGPLRWVDILMLAVLVIWKIGGKRWGKVCARSAFAALFVAGIAHAGTPHQVLDLNSVSVPLSSEPRALGRLGSVELFQATLAIPELPRTALVKSDGTAAGTVTLKVFQGSGPGYQRPTVVGARAFFVAHETASGNQVWVTDGTADGTRQITHFAQPTPPNPSPTPLLLAAFGNDLLFAYNSGGGSVLYRTDGTSAGTTDLGPISPTSNGPVEFDIVTVSSKIYFISPANNVPELWVSDGTKAGTQKIPTTSTPNIRELRAVNGGVVFTSNAGLARVDAGTNAITLLNVFPSVAAPGTPGSSTLVELNGYLYFAGTQSAPNDLELWRSDGTPGGTTLVKNINASASSFGNPDVVRVGNRVVFVADDGSGARLWSSDGTDAGTTAIYNTGVTFSFGLGDAILPAIQTMRARYVFAYIGSTLVTIMTDGTAAGTRLLAPTIEGNRASFIDATGDANADYQLFATQNQTTGETTTYAFKFTSSNQYSTVKTSLDAFGSSSFVLIGDKLVFDAWDDTAGQELWVSDSAGPRQLVDLTPNSYTGHSNPQWLTDWNGKLVFSADDGAHGAELWISDGTAGGTKRLTDINPGTASSAPRQLYVWNGALYFFANNGSYRLMRLTSPEATPEVLATIDPPPRYDVTVDTDSLRCPLPTPAPMGNKLFFSAKDATHGTELWSTDGTAAGTAMVLDLNPNASGATPIGSLPCNLTPFKNRLYFSADATGTGQLSDGMPLWSTDGTAAGTTRFSTTGAGGPTAVYNNELYFRAVDASTSVTRTWKTADGTQASATLVGDVGNPNGVVNGNVMFLQSTVVSTSPLVLSYQIWAANSAGTVTAISDSAGGFSVQSKRIYFMRNVSGTSEIWSSDGTPAGNQRVKILGPTGGAYQYWVTDFRGITILITLDSDGRRRVWRTDGTEAGTKEIGVTAARSTTGAAVGPVVSGQNVFYAGLDITGNELYAIPNDAPMAVADTATTSVGQAVTVTVLANDSDPDGAIDVSSVVPVQPPAHGSVLLNANGTITYTPAAGYSGGDSFTYRVADNQGNTSIGTVTLTVTGAGGNNGGGGASGGEGGGGGGGPLRWIDLLALGALLSLRVVRNTSRRSKRGKNLSAAVNNL